MRRKAHQYIQELEIRVASLEKQAYINNLGQVIKTSNKASKEIDLKSAISLGESKIQRQLDDIVYQGKKIVDQYDDWAQKIEFDELYTGMDIDLLDSNGFECEIQDVRPEYLGYNANKDFFVVGYDLEIYSVQAEEAYERHQDASNEYEEALEEWENLDEDEQDMTDMPEEDDYPGIDYMLSFPRTEDACAYAIFQIQQGRVIVRDVQLIGEKRFEDCHAKVKRKCRLVDLYVG